MKERNVQTDIASSILTGMLVYRYEGRNKIGIVKHQCLLLHHEILKSSISEPRRGRTGKVACVGKVAI